MAFTKAELCFWWDPRRNPRVNAEKVCEVRNNIGGILKLMSYLVFVPAYRFFTQNMRWNKRRGNPRWC